jgi:hypothetical protein
MEVYAGIVDEDIERIDLVGSFPNLRGIGHVQRQAVHAFVGMHKGLARSGIHALRTSSQGFINQRPTDATVRTGN